MTDNFLRLLENEDFDEAIYLDEFLQTANLRQIFEKKRKIQKKLEKAIENRNKLLNAIELTIVNGILNINKISHTTKNLEFKSKKIATEFQELWKADKPILECLKGYIEEFNYLKSDVASMCLEDVPGIIRTALENDDVVKALAVYSNILSSGQKLDHLPEIKRIIPKILPLRPEIEKRATSLIMNGSVLPIDSVYSQLKLIGIDGDLSLTLDLINSINFLDNLLEILNKPSNDLFVSNSILFLDKLSVIKKLFPMDSEESIGNTCIKCTLRAKNPSETIRTLLAKFCKNGKFISKFCFKCYISPLINKLFILNEVKRNDLIDKIKLLDLKEFNYCLVTEELKALKSNLDSEFDLILKTLLSNLEYFLSEINEDLFNSVLKSIKSAIDTSFDFYTKISGYVDIDVKHAFSNVCSDFLSKIIKIFAQVAILQSMFNNKHKVMELLPKIDRKTPLLDNYTTFNPLINVKGGTKEVSSQAYVCFNGMDDKIILSNDNEALELSLRLIFYIGKIFLPKITDYMNSTFSYFESEQKDIDLYLKLDIIPDCSTCESSHSFKTIPIEIPNNTLNEALKFILSQLVINTSISTVNEIGKKIVSISPLIVYEDDFVEIQEIVYSFKNKLANMLDVLEIVPKSTSTCSFDNLIASNRMYINIDPLIKDRHGLIHYYLYLIIIQLIEYLRFEYINSPSLLNNILLKLSQSCNEVLKARGITYLRQISNLWNMSATSCMNWLEQL